MAEREHTGKAGGVIGVAIETIFIATLGITAVGLVVNANYSGWGEIQTMMFKTVLVIVIAIGFILLVLQRAGYKIQM